MPQVIIQAEAVVLLGGGESLAIFALEVHQRERATIVGSAKGNLPTVVHARLPALAVDGRVVIGRGNRIRSPCTAGEVTIAYHGSIGDILLDIRHRAGEAAHGIGQETHAQRLAVVAHYQIDALVVPAGKAVVKIYAAAHERECLGGVGLNNDFILRRRLGQADGNRLSHGVKDELCRVAHGGIVNQGEVAQRHPHRIDAQCVIGIVAARATIDILTDI